MAHMTFEAGLLLRSAARDYLNKIKFIHNDIDWIENKHLVYSEFTVKGNDNAIIEVQKSIKNWVQEQNNANK